MHRARVQGVYYIHYTFVSRAHAVHPTTERSRSAAIMCFGYNNYKKIFNLIIILY